MTLITIILYPYIVYVTYDTDYEMIDYYGIWYRIPQLLPHSHHGHENYNFKCPCVLKMAQFSEER